MKSLVPIILLVFLTSCGSIAIKRNGYWQTVHYAPKKTHSRLSTQKAARPEDRAEPLLMLSEKDASFSFNPSTTASAPSYISPLKPPSMTAFNLQAKDTIEAQNEGVEWDQDPRPVHWTAYATVASSALFFLFTAVNWFLVAFICMLLIVGFFGNYMDKTHPNYWISRIKRKNSSERVEEPYRPFIWAVIAFVITATLGWWYFFGRLFEEYPIGF